MSPNHDHKSKITYQSLHDELETPAFDPWNRKQRPSWKGRCCVALIFACLCTNIVTAVLVWHFAPANKCSDQFYSPVLDTLDLPYKETQMSAVLINNASIPSHIYRLPPSDEVDAAWDRISNPGIHGISRESVIRLGKDPSTAIMAPDSWGFPPQSYMMQVNGFHQIHCLNAMRKALIFNYDYYWGGKFNATPPLMFMTHINHCMDMVLQTLMCHADSEAIVYNWREGQTQPYADFAINKKCRDFNQLVEWRDANKLQDAHTRWVAFKKPADANEVPAQPGHETLGPIVDYRGTLPLAKINAPPGCYADASS